MFASHLRDCRNGRPDLTYLAWTVQCAGGVGASLTEKMIRMQTYTVDIAGEPVTLPIMPINDMLAI